MRSMFIRTVALAVLLLAGSGPQDRDETVGANAPLRDLAQGLSARGLVVLRYDKRTHTYGADLQNRPVTVEEEVLADAVAALAWLRQRAEVDPARVWVVGHSLGALLAQVCTEQVGQVVGEPGVPAIQLGAQAAEETLFLFGFRGVSRLFDRLGRFSSE